MSERIPVRLWSDPTTPHLGYLYLHDGETDSDTTKYEMSFQECPIAEPPRFDIRFTPKD